MLCECEHTPFQEPQVRPVPALLPFGAAPLPLLLNVASSLSALLRARPPVPWHRQRSEQAVHSEVGWRLNVWLSNSTATVKRPINMQAGRQIAKRGPIIASIR